MAAASWQEAGDIDGDTAKYDLILASLAESEGDEEAAVGHLRAAVAKSPTEIRYRLRLAEALGDDPAAVEQIEEALRLNDAFAPDEPERLSSDEVEALRNRLALPAAP